MNALTASDLRLETPDGRLLFENLSMTIRRGQSWALLGENGVGKSTLLRCLAGLSKPTSGHVNLAGLGVSSNPAALARIRAYLPQKTDYPADQTVLETVLSGRYPHRRFWQWRESLDDHRIARQAIDAMKLRELSDKPIGALSGGEARRAAIAAAVAQGGDWMLLDEPTTFLDISRQHQTFSLLTRLVVEHSRALVVALQDPNLAMRYCTHSLLLFDDGRWIAGESLSVLTTRNLSALYNHPIDSVVCFDQTHFVAQ